MFSQSILSPGCRLASPAARPGATVHSQSLRQAARLVLFVLRLVCRLTGSVSLGRLFVLCGRSELFGGPAARRGV